MPAGRPKGSKSAKLKPSKQQRGLRLEFYSDMPSSKGGIVSGIADQYGRVLEQFVNENNQIDLRPTGHSIAVRH